MGNESIILVITPVGVEVQTGIGDRLTFQAPGLDIYVNGKELMKNTPILDHMAALECQARSIQLISLKRVAGRTAPKRGKVAAGQLKLFGNGW